MPAPSNTSGQFNARPILHSSSKSVSGGKTRRLADSDGAGVFCGAPASNGNFSRAEFREAVHKVQSINEQAWTSENHSVELTSAATTIENARMEWNSARLKFPLLAGAPQATPEPSESASRRVFPPDTDLLELCKIGLALNWPLVLLGAGIFMVLLWRR